MKLLIVLALVSYAAAAAIDSEAKVLSQTNDINPDGTYNFGLKIDNGIEREEIGELKVVNDDENKPHPVIIVKGQYTQQNSDGKFEEVRYTADENGFHPESILLPRNA